MSDSVLIVLRIAIAGVLVIAAVGKAGDRGQLRTAATDLGIPGWAAVPISLALAPAEILIAAGLLPGATAWAAAIAATTLFLAFFLLVTVNVARGRRPSCHCFGALHEAPIGWPTVARNAILLALALAIVLADAPTAGPGLAAWIDQHLDGSGRAAFLVIALAVLAVSEAALLARVRSTRRQSSPVGSSPDDQGPGLPVGSTAPAFALPDSGGRRWTLRGLLAEGRPVALVFLSEGCGPCSTLLPHLSQVADSARGLVTLVVVTDGPRDAAQAKQGQLESALVLSQPGLATAKAYRYEGTPAAVMVNPDGLVASSIASGLPAVHQLLVGAVGDAADRAGSPSEVRSLGLGDLIPPLILKSFDDGWIDLGTPRGRLSLIVFWDPRCGFCQRLLPAMRQWADEQGPDGAGMIVLSLGNQDETRVLGFPGVVGFDERRVAAKSLGADGTPMALLVDASGRVASEVVAGAEDVLALAERASRLVGAAAAVKIPVRGELAPREAAVP